MSRLKMLKFNPDEVKRPLLALVSIIVIIASLISIYLSQRTPTPKINLKPFEGLGQAVADETVKLINDNGEVVLLVMQLEIPNMPEYAAPLEAFRNTLKSHPGIRISTVEPVETTLQAVMERSMLISADQFLSYLDKHSRASVIVSFVGVPPLQGSDLEKLPDRRPKIIDAGALEAKAYSPELFIPDLKDLMERDIVQVGVLPRFQPGKAETKEPVTAKEWFDRSHVVITKANISEIPDF